jgi:hypothetical protein
MIARAGPVTGNSPKRCLQKEKRARQKGAHFLAAVVSLSRFGLLRRIATFAFFARQRDRGPYSATHEFHQTRHNPFIGVDASTA